MRSSLWALCALGLISATATLGCKKEATDAPAEPATTESAATDDADAATTEDSDVFADLSETERTAAMAQKICPVTGDSLGSMGTPFKVTVEGRDVFLCCEGCRESLEAEPAKYLAKLDAPASGDDDATATP